MGGEDWRAAFAVRKRRQRTVATAFAAVVAAVVVAAGAFRVSADYWMPALGGFGIAALFFSLANWKCPACGETLSTRRSTTACPGCDARLED